MSNWCHEFDFATDDGGFDTVPLPGYPDLGQWIEGSGWKNVTYTLWGATGSPIYIGRTFAQRQIDKIEFTTHTVTAVGTQPAVNVWLPTGSGGYYGVDLRLRAGGVESWVYEGPWTVNEFQLNVSDNGVQTFYITRCRVYGTGANPFVPTVSLVDNTEAPDQDAYLYRAPITGNDTYVNLTVNNNTRPLAIGQYAIDPLNNHLWLHTAYGWVKATANDYMDGTVLRPNGCLWEQDDDYDDTDRIEVAPAALGNFQLPLEDILRIISNGVANGSYTLPQLVNVPWPQTGTVTDSELAMLTHFPMSLTQVCQGGIQSFPLYGVGCDTGAIYDGAPGEHAGLDVFAPSGSNVYSMADNGLIVGIGIGPTNGSYQQRSAAYWGAAAVTETIGYSVIVRQKHLFVLYGHLRALDSAIYVGKQINAGTLLGQVGTATNPGAVPHTHIEVRSFGADIPTTDPNTGSPLQTLVRDTSGGYNDYGILANGGQPAVNIYEPAQFFAATVVALVSDSASTTINVTGLGKAIVDDDKVQFDTTTLPSPCGMPLSNGKPELTYCSGAVGSDVQQVSGYRGFKLGQGSLDNSVAPDVAPTQVTTSP